MFMHPKGHRDYFKEAVHSEFQSERIHMYVFITQSSDPPIYYVHVFTEQMAEWALM